MGRHFFFIALDTAGAAGGVRAGQHHLATGDFFCFFITPRLE
jgi:hypothetical protein